MRTLGSAIGVAILSLTVACGGGADGTQPDTQNDIAAATTPDPLGTDPVGTAGQTDEAASATADDSAAQAPASLPATASPLPLAGGLGVLLLSGAAALRWYRNRSN